MLMHVQDGRKEVEDSIMLQDAQDGQEGGSNMEACLRMFRMGRSKSVVQIC